MTTHLTPRPALLRRVQARKAAVGVAPRNSTVLGEYGTALLVVGKVDAAIRVFTDAVAIDPANIYVQVCGNSDR